MGCFQQFWIRPQEWWNWNFYVTWVHLQGECTQTTPRMSATLRGSGVEHLPVQDQRCHEPACWCHTCRHYTSFHRLCWRSCIWNTENREFTDVCFEEQYSKWWIGVDRVLSAQWHVLVIGTVDDGYLHEWSPFFELSVTVLRFNLMRTDLSRSVFQYNLYSLCSRRNVRFSPVWSFTDCLHSFPTGYARRHVALRNFKIIFWQSKQILSASDVFVIETVVSVWNGKVPHLANFLNVGAYPMQAPHQDE